MVSLRRVSPRGRQDSAVHGKCPLSDSGVGGRGDVCGHQSVKTSIVAIDQTSLTYTGWWYVMVACMRPGVVRYGSIHQCRGWKEYSSLSSDLANHRVIQCHVTEEVWTTELQ